jgi:hypothetical protein
MRKVLFLFAVLTAMVFTSCEKEEQPQLLSEFIVGGEWIYEMQEELQTLTFLGQFFTDGTYLLKLTDGTNEVPFTGDWSVDDETDVLTLDEPDFENTGDTEQAYFNVEWIEGVEQMVWTQIGNETNVLTWTR